MGSSKKTLEWYKQKLDEIHSSSFCYDMWTNLGQYHDKIPIICSTHGLFHSTLANHLTRKSGCPMCRADARKLGFNKRSTIDWINKAAAAHGIKFTYDSSAIISDASTDKVVIICPTHGMFQQTFVNHILSPTGCPECSRDWSTRDAYHPSQTHIPTQSLENLTDYDWMYLQHITHKLSLTEIATMLGVGDTAVGKYMKLHGIDTVRYNHSIGENQLAEFINKYVKVVRNSRTALDGLEIDIYIPSLNLGIEYCGLYWHSDKFKDPGYHANKFQLAKSKGIRLITIFEDEWIDSRVRVEQKLIHILGATKDKIFARKCQVVLVDSDIKTQFFNCHHQYDDHSSINFGLMFNNELVSCIGLTTNQPNKYVITQYAASIHVVGGYSKLIKHIHNILAPSTIEAYVDLRWDTGKFYISSGWTHQCTIGPDYYLTDGRSRYNKKQSCNTDNLLSIWDCGKIKFILTFFKGLKNVICKI